MNRRSVRFGRHGFIVTLGMLIVLRGLLTGVSGGQTFFNLPDSMMYLGNAIWIGVPVSCGQPWCAPVCSRPWAA